MELEFTKLDKKLVFLFMLCTELNIDFRKLRKLYKKDNDNLWTYIVTLQPALRISENRFCKLSKFASNVLSSLKFNKKLKLNQRERFYHKYISFFTKNVYVVHGVILSEEDLFNYAEEFKKTINLNYIENTNEIKSIQLTDNKEVITLYTTSVYSHTYKSMYKSLQDEELAHIETICKLKQLATKEEKDEKAVQ